MELSISKMLEIANLIQTQVLEFVAAEYQITTEQAKLNINSGDVEYVALYTFMIQKAVEQTNKTLNPTGTEGVVFCMSPQFPFK